MNNDLVRNVIKKHCSNVKKYEIHKNVIIYTLDNGKRFVAKKNGRTNIINTYNYLNSRGFGYLPRLVYYDDYGYVYEYEEDSLTPDEQKISDIIKTDALLHNKTVYYKDISVDEIKEIYENLSSKIESTFNYYDDLITMIDSKIYPSPSEYMLARNCSSIFSCLNFCKKELDIWYEMISSKEKKREVFLHNNLDFEHLIRNNDNVLISWDNATRDMPIYDFIKLYKNNYNKYDFNHLYKEYVSRFPLLPDEKKLLFILLFIPWEISFSDNELLTTIEVSKLCNYLFITDRLFMENEAKYSKEQNHKIEE